MAKKERPLTARQMEALKAAFAEPTLYGDHKLIEGCGRSFRGLHNRGLVEGKLPHVYLTPKGVEQVTRLVG